MPRNILIAALALGSATVSAQTVNTQVDGITITNGLSSITDASAISATNQSVAVGFLTDNDTTTLVYNLGYRQSGASGAIQGTFGGTISSDATGVFLVSQSYKGMVPFNGPFSMQLQLLSGLSSSRSFGDSDFIVTSQIYSFTAYQNAPYPQIGQTVTSANFPVSDYVQYAYLYVPFSDFGATYNQVAGIKLGDFTFQYLDLSYVGLGYLGGAPVPEPSTYGLALGGLALAVVAARRRKISK